MANNAEKRKGWTMVNGFHTIDGKNDKKYTNMVRYERPCSTCGAIFGMYVTQAVASGFGYNNSFGLRNCENHRMKMVDVDGKPRIEPFNQVEPAKQDSWGFPKEPAPTNDDGSWTPPPALTGVERLEAINKCLKEEIKCKDDLIKELDVKIAALEKCCTEYESQIIEESYDEIYPGEPQPAENGFDPHELLRQDIAAKNNSKKLPWEA